MSSKVKIPVYSKDKGFEQYKQELQAWKEVTDVDAKKQAIAVALTIPDKDDSRIRERVFR